MQGYQQQSVSSSEIMRQQNTDEFSQPKSKLGVIVRNPSKVEYVDEFHHTPVRSSVKSTAKFGKTPDTYHFKTRDLAMTSTRRNRDRIVHEFNEKSPNSNNWRARRVTEHKEPKRLKESKSEKTYSPERTPQYIEQRQVP